MSEGGIFFGGGMIISRRNGRLLSAERLPVGSSEGEAGGYAENLRPGRIPERFSRVRIGFAGESVLKETLRGATAILGIRI